MTPSRTKPGADDLLVFADGVLDWRRKRYPCTLGRAGVAEKKREGDGATPVGAFPLRCVLYRPDRLPPPATRLPVAPLSPLDAWCDDPKDSLYNQPVRQPYPGRVEILWREDRIYDLIVILGYNDAPVIPGHGSAIFLHLMAPDRRATRGCIALARNHLLEILAGLQPVARLIVTKEASVDAAS